MRMSEISRENVAHLAKLARLELSEDELQSYGDQIDDIIEHGAAISTVESEGVAPPRPPTQNVDGAVSVMREDVVMPVLTAEQALDQAPAVQDQRFQVRQILAD